MTIDDGDKENDPDDTGTQLADDSSSSVTIETTETTELEAERTTSAKRLYNTKQKRVGYCVSIMFVVWFSYSCSSLADEWCPDSLVHVVAANDPGHRELHRLAPQSSEASSSPSRRRLL